MFNKFTIILLVATCATVLACTKVCKDDVRYVCGTNDVTYSNQCKLDCAAEDNPTIKFKSNGQCNGAGTKQGNAGICQCGVNSACGNC